jgi:hypothetical protein
MVRNPVLEQEINEEFTVSNISSRDYGCVVVKGGGLRLTNLEEKYDGLKILVTEPVRPKGPVEVNLIGSGRAATYTIIKDLSIEVDVTFGELKLTSERKKRSYFYRVNVSENNGSYCLF